MNCFDCEKPMVHGDYPCVEEIKGEDVVFMNPGWWCTPCEHGYHSDEDRIVLREKIDNYPNAPPAFKSIEREKCKTF